ncbi:MAG TPA: dihydrodipicolinate synthase family protein, partial [Burkholderiaceae bacterium]|nr:dihydrodipicolinate synthase family protein [Burkholderiaceae bacterium]
MQIRLPQADGTLKTTTLKARPIRPSDKPAAFNRTVYAAAHVVVDPIATVDPWDASPAIDWDGTLRFREHLWSLGFKVAEAMDTAQRGMGVDWPVARELIQRSLRHARTVPGADLACGAGTDQLAAGPEVTLAQVEAAYREQIGVVEAEGGRVILMASRALARCARGPDDYLSLYGRLLRDVSQPVVLHWLGEMFDPALSGYWGSKDLAAALETVTTLIRDNAGRIEGIKVSLLDAKWELELRQRLPSGVKMYTGDDFNYAELIAGDDKGYSDALLGIFDATAPAASAALAALAAGDRKRFDDILAPTVPLSRHIFKAPTRFYKTGVVFMAYLNGLQDHFT